MKHEVLRITALLAALCLLFSACGFSSQEEIPSASADIFAMDTCMTVTAYGERAEEAVDAAAAEINRLDALWSVGNPESEIARVNASGSLTVSEETCTLVEEALRLYDSTGGAFDITVYPLMEAWGFPSGDYRVPDVAELESLLALTGADNVRLDADTRTLTLSAGTQIDLGGIAKGYTSARVMEIFAEYGITSGIVSLGGNVQTYGSKTDGSNWRVGVQNPDSSLPALASAEYAGILSITDKAVITSGGYERYFEEDGKTYHHILDPATGCPADSGLISVTIVSDDGLLADGLSTALFVMGKDEALSYWRAHSEEFDTVLVDSEGNVFVTSGIADSFSSDLAYTVIQ